jgi:hypothetical protein
MNEIITYALLNRNGIPQICTSQEWLNWFRNGGEEQMKIKRETVNEWEIDVWFQGNSAEQDGPFSFWEVTANHPSDCPFVRRRGTQEEALTVQLGEEAAQCEWRSNSFWVLNHPGLMGIKDLGEFKYTAIEAFRGILHTTVNASLRKNPPIPTWASDRVREAWNMN